jgi:hydrogenase maturation protease
VSAGRVLVVGFGNALAGDDGAGPAVIACLQRRGLPAGARAEEGGQDALRLAGRWRGEPEVWLVDALLPRASPGSVRRFGHEEVLGLPQRHGTAHQLSLPECLRWLAHGYPEMAGVRYRMWGIEASRIELVDGLSAPVAAAVARVCDELAAELEVAASPETTAARGAG